MTRRIVYAPRTLRDLEEVHAYLVDEAQNRTVADRFLSRLLAACTTLQTLPERFAAYPYARTWRMMPCGDLRRDKPARPGERRISETGERKAESGKEN